MTNTVNRIATISLGVAALLFTTSAHATGVTAGTLIENTASASYTLGTATSTVQSNTVTVKVDELLDVAVAGLTTTPAPIGSDPAVLSYAITNTGNGPEAFILIVNPVVTGNQFDAGVQSVVVDTNGNGTYDQGVDQVLATGAATPLIAADATLTVFVLATLPGGATEGQTSQIRLTADAVTGTGTPGTAFAGQGEGGGDAVVGASGASSNALDSVIASLVTVNLVKSAVVADPFGGSQPVPGAIVTYTLVATVSGTGSAQGLRITDAIPSGTAYQTGSLTLEGTGLSDGADGDAGTASAAGIAVDLGTVPSGSNRTVRFNVRIN